MNFFKLPFTSKFVSFIRGFCYLITESGKLTFVDSDGTRREIAMKPTVTTVVPVTTGTVTTLPFVDEIILVNPAGTIAAMTVLLPSKANSRIGQVKRFNYTQIVSTLTTTVVGSGTKTGPALAAAAVNVPYEYTCVSLLGAGTWLRTQ